MPVSWIEAAKILKICSLLVVMLICAELTTVQGSIKDNAAAAKGTPRRGGYQSQKRRPVILTQVKPEPIKSNRRPIRKPWSDVVPPNKKLKSPPKSDVVKTFPRAPPNNRRPIAIDSLEAALNGPKFKCGTVPLFEKLYGRSINESLLPDDSGDFRILYGLDSIVGEWPWIARIRECDYDGCGVCTGTLLNSRWLITAGHCGFGKLGRLKQFRVTLGLYDLITPDKGSFTAPIDRLIVHPNYVDLNNDIALIRLASRVKFNDYIQPACLVRSTRSIITYAQDKKCYTVGYGLVEGMNDAIKLQKLQIRAKLPNECNSDRLGAVQLKPGTVCIGPPAGEVGAACKGDSGGPDLCYDPTRNQWVLFGTVSYGPAICDRDQGDHWLTVSVDLSNYRTWIVQTIVANGV